MSRKKFGAKPLCYPQPVFIVATYDENGVLTINIYDFLLSMDCLDK